jgi:DNA-binding CsgD family transcriptional regulator
MSIYSFLYTIAINIHRSPGSLTFTDRDYEILKIITPHFNNIRFYLSKISKLETIHWQAAASAKECRLLSKREAEVATLLCQKLTMAEVATKLMISPRTVQTHVEKIKEKLKVRNKRELVLKLTGLPKEKP